jgi:hypothetical protein
MKTSYNSYGRKSTIVCFEEIPWHYNLQKLKISAENMSFVRTPTTFAADCR